jgi:TM2 domain-containing membrane protein YozV
MNLATKAALLSALLFPGWGQIYLKKYKRGLAIILPVAAGTLSIVWAAVQVALAVLKTTPFKKGSVHFSDIVILAVNSVKVLDLFYLKLIMIFMILLSIFSIIDAYLLGKKEIQSTVAPKESI